MVDNKCLLSAIQWSFATFGRAIGGHPGKFIVLTSLAILASCAGLYRLYLDDDIRFGYTPDDAPSRHEFAVYEQFFGISEPFGMAVWVQALDGGNLLRPEHFNATAEFYRFVNEDILVSTSEIRNFSYSESCHPNCKLNIGYEKFVESLWTQRALLSDQRPLDSGLTLSYPRIELAMDSDSSDYPDSMSYTQLDISGHFYDVELNDSLLQVTGTNMASTKLVMFWYYGTKANQTMNEGFSKWELAVFEHIINLNSSLIKAHVFGDVIANREATRSAFSVMPLVVVGWGSMFAFVLINVMLCASFYGRVQLSQLWIVFATIVSPISAVLATFGLMAWVGEPLSSLMGVMPLLVVAIGVDDAFLLLHSWQRLSSRDEAEHSAAQTMSTVLREIGPSIAITSVTNTLAFAVGAFTPVPEIQRFCMATAIAISMDFVFELTLFSPVLVIIGKRQTVGEQSAHWVKSKNKLNQVVKQYSAFLTSWKAQILAVFVIGVCWTVSILGIMSMDVAFAPHKTFTADSPIIEVNGISEIVYSERQATNFIVSNPPNLPNATELESFKQMIKDLESLPNSLGPDYTMVWLTEYETMVHSSSFFSAIIGLEEVEEDLTYEDLPEFLSLFPIVSQMRTIKWHETDSGIVVDSFYFYTCFHNMTTWSDRVEKVSQIRAVLANYPQFNVTLWEYDVSIYDISLVVKQVTFAAGVVTMCCMAVVCLVFIPSLCSVLIATLAIGSICVNTLGFLSWWDADLDPFTMVTIIMSVGFSVDYTSHLVFHFHKSPGSPAQRLQHTLHAVALPMLQAGASTVICISFLAFHNSYMIVIFGKMVFLVVSSGLLHGLFIVPTVLAALPTGCTAVKKEKATIEKEEMIALK